MNVSGGFAPACASHARSTWVRRICAIGVAFFSGAIAPDASAVQNVWTGADASLYRLPVYRSGRGGQYTYHGPGQRIAYVMLDLNRFGRDVRCHVWRLEEWMIAALARFNVRGERRDGRIGIWVAAAGGREDKIAAIGVRVRRWVSYHGVALNVDPDLDHFRGIIPCGIAPAATGHGVTSLAKLGITASMADVDIALRATFDDVFGAAATCAT